MARAKPAGEANRAVSLNDEQRRALDCDRNAVVAAGAGSGKTSVLAGRYVRLITGAHLRPDQILTLTFTRKAAAEMYQRIHGALSAESLAAGKGDPAGAALADFFHAHIQTLDSYCAYIVRQGASRYGIRPDFTIDDQGARELADRESLPFLISRRHHPALERLYRGKRPADIAHGLFAASAFEYGCVDERPSYTRGTAAQFDLIRARWDQAAEELQPLVDELVSLALEEQEDSFLLQLKAPAQQCRAAHFITGTELKTYFDGLLTLEDSKGNPVAAAEDHPLRGRITGWLRIIHDLAFANAARGKRNSRAKEIARELRRLYAGFSSILVFVLQGGIILSVMALLEEFQDSYVEKKRAQGILTFTDVAHLARTILRDQRDIRDNEKAAFKAVMIDEFQDNNSLQKELLFLLAERQDCHALTIPEAAGLEGEKLFFVGDEKQSVYRFRGADVSVFRELKNELAAEDLHLAVNYRSSPQLIACFNALFGGSLYDPSGASPLFQYAAVFAPPKGLPPYEADYSPLRAGITEGGEVRVCVLDSRGDEDDGEDDMGTNESEAVFTAAAIKKLLEEKDESGLPRYSPDDVAILFRSRKAQRLFEKHLRLLDIPYAGEGLGSFFADGPVNDLAAFLRLTAYPLDTEAYAISLRSPLAGLSLRGLAFCIDAFNGAEPTALPFSGPPPPDEADRRAYELGGELYRRIREQAAGLSISQLLNRLWYDEGYRYETAWNPRTGAHRELFDYLYGQAVKADDEGLSLAAFSDRLEAMREREEPLADMEIPLERPGAVRLLTIHKSKGLEFKAVFIVCCGNRSGGRRNDREIYYSASNRALSFNPPLPPECAGIEGVKRNFFYEQDRLEERRKETAELRRLLYVAMTRARQRLFLTGAFPLEARDRELLSALRARLDEKKAAGAKKNEDQGFRALEGDRILDDGTFFGLLLPALAESRPYLEGGLPQSGELPPYLKLEAIPAPEPPAAERRDYPNTRAGLSRFLRDAAPLYARARVVDTPVLAQDHLSPSGAKERIAGSQYDHDHTAIPGPAFLHSPALSGRGAADLFTRIDPILARLAFHAEFGTIAHLCVEARLTGTVERLPPALAGRLGAAEAETLLEAGKAVAERFLASPLGIEARGAARRWSEYPFRSLWREGAGEGTAGQEFFINGVIDLLYEWEDGVRVVDFKTDGVERPEEHLAQMSCYERAARELRGKPCRVWLYYLRTGRAVEIKDFSLSTADRTDR
ncbi:MAG: UvrD-helicase domain-containing protein [Treponema sp.]|jgi:ATP-dependent helicase/nuclease subunit A|nr:UvrD-helicase domain-containing protein [Treponema sp.]